MKTTLGHVVLRNVKNELYDVWIKNKKYPVPEEVFDYISSLKNKVKDLEYAEKELKSIKPILSNGDFDPPVSKHCQECDFVVLSMWDKTPVGCRKNLVCESFRKKDT